MGSCQWENALRKILMGTYVLEGVIGKVLEGRCLWGGDFEGAVSGKMLLARFL